MLVKTYCAAVNGLEVTTVTIEVSMNIGVMYRFTGLGDTAVKEGRDRIASALQQVGYKFPHGDITVNMAPSQIRLLVRPAVGRCPLGSQREHRMSGTGTVHDCRRTWS